MNPDSRARARQQDPRSGSATDQDASPDTTVATPADTRRKARKRWWYRPRAFRQREDVRAWCTCDWEGWSRRDAYQHAGRRGHVVDVKVEVRYTLRPTRRAPRRVGT